MRPEQLKRNRTKLKKNKTKQNKQTNKQKLQALATASCFALLPQDIGVEQLYWIYAE